MARLLPKNTISIKQTVNSLRPTVSKNYGRNVEEQAFLNALDQGFNDVQDGRIVSLGDTRKRLGLV